MTNELRSDMALAAARRADGVIRDIASAGASHWSAEALDRSATVALGRWLQARAYGFTTGTPETHRRVLANGHREVQPIHVDLSLINDITNPNQFDRKNAPRHD